MPYEQKEVILTLDDLKGLCAFWQKELGLSDWQVEVRIDRETKLRANDARSTIFLNEYHRRALLQVLDPADYDADDIIKQDMEFAIVHELLHIWFEAANLNLEQFPEKLVEQPLNAIAYALVSLKRQASERSSVIPAGQEHTGTSHFEVNGKGMPEDIPAGAV